MTQLSSTFKATTIARLGDVAMLNPGLVDKLDSDEEVAFVPMAAVSEHGTVVNSVDTRTFGEVRTGYTYFQSNDVLLAKITPCFENGKISLAALNHEHGFGSTEFHVVRASPSRLDARYLVHFLRQDWLRTEGERKMTGSAGQKRVPRHFLESLEIPLPPLGEQKRIAAILDAADALRQKRRQALRLLDQLSQSLFIEMFGDPASNPMGWPTAELGSLLLDGPQNGLYKPASSYGAGTRILRIDAFYDGRVKALEGLKRLDISQGEIELYGLRKNDIIINRVNSIEYLGKSAIVPRLDEPVVFESNMMRMRVNPRVVLPGYAIEYLQTRYIRGQIRTGTKDAVNQSSINQGDVRSFLFRLPPLDLQQSFVSTIERARALLGVLENGRDEVLALFASLQHRAFRGEL
jgi:type I restriction enzyme, S subunit